MRVLAAVLAFLLAPCAAAADPAYLEELVAKSRELHLAERAEWLKLGHYLPNLIAPGVHSLVDSRQFFNSPEGKTDPRAELEATLASFYSEVEETPERQNPQCLFVARRAWLDEQLHFDPKRMPQQECKRYREWHDALNAKSLTLVFASAYLNNPSSMYGHTLLRVDARDQDERTRLLAYAINFTAVTNESNGVLFAVKGLFGFYPGAFSTLPYYLKISQYSDMENRDLWEYELALSQEEVERVLRHAWELLSAYFDYYFFDENCSYHLNGLLQVARPELDLTASFRWWALPSDTVRELTKHPGLVARTVYRPANATRIAARLDRLGREERAMAKELSLGTTASEAGIGALPPERAAAVLETAHDYVNYRRAIGRPDVPDPAARVRDLLVARSRVDAPSQAPAITPPTPPDQGHGSARASAGIGQRAGQRFAEAELRPVYQDIMDPDAGYVRGAQIEFFKLGVRHYEDSGTRVERFVPIDIFSVAPRDEFFQPTSWHISAGWQRMALRDGSEPLVANVIGGAGGAWSFGKSTTAYATADGSLRAHHDLEGGYGLGAGGRAGLLFDATPAWRFHAYAQGIDYFAGEHDTPHALGLQQRFSLGKDVALRFDLTRKRESGRDLNEGSLSLMLYF